MASKYLIFLLVVTSVTAEDWCNIARCPLNTHIGCNNDGNFFSTCINPQAVTFTPDQIASIVHRHNYLRSQTALGLTAGLDGNLPQSVRMAQIRWDSTLAHVANLNVKQCEMRHDACRNTDEFHFSGQNLAMSFTSGNIDINSFIVNMVDLWFNEHQLAFTTDIPSFDSARLNEIGHFTALVNERQTHVGCAMSMFDQVIGGNTWRAGLLACNYAFTNMIGWPVYTTGDVASQCTTGRDNVYLGLCSLNESINPNP